MYCTTKKKSVEAVNNNIKLIIRKAYGFRNVENLKAMVLLCCARSRSMYQSVSPN
ncbi:transposase [Duodenibacillus massiliensis]|uniref:transposase n=1 Tax=Duodenibacillus massiliensis TaxID=1852381 RepID=UPI000A02487B